MSEDISLYDLLNLSIGTPHKGSVNFSALYALLLAVLKQLNIRELKIQWRNSLFGDTSPDASVDVSARDREQDEVQRDVSETDQPVQPGSDGSTSPASDSAPEGKGTLLTRIQTCENDMSEAMELIKELQKQKDNLEEKIEELQQQHKAPDSQAETPTELEKCCHRVDALENAVSSLKETLQKYPDPDKLSQQVPWDLVQSTLFNLTKGLTNTDVLDPTISAEPSPTIGPPLTPSSSSPNDHHTTPAAPSSLNVFKSGLNPQETDNTTEASSIQPDPPSQVTDDPDLNTADVEAQQASSSAWYQEMMVAVRTIDKLQERFIQLEVRMATLEQMMDQVQLAQLRGLTTTKGSVEFDGLMAQLNQQKALIENLMSDRENLDNLKDMLMNLMMEDRSSSSEAAPKSLDVESSAFYELRQQVLYLRKCSQKLEEDMRHLRHQQVLLGKGASDQHLQDQLDDLRGMLEASILSQTSLMSRGLQDKSENQGSEGTERSALTSGPVKADSELSLLFQHYEQLQASVNNLILQHSQFEAWQLEEGQAARNMGPMKDVQRVVLQLQEDCEKLQETTRILQEDDKQKQGRIKELYKMTEELEVKKADKQMESEIKTDQSGLENHVSQLQFDSVMKQQNSKFHELLNKMTNQQQNWQELIHRLSSEMETKLSRIELDSLMMQLEKRCKSIQEKLEAQESLPEHDNASLFKKQLLEKFHCLSCDRPVLMQIPGPTLNTLPSYPAFPSPKSTKPFNSDQVRQQYRRLKPGISRYNCWMGTSGRKRTEFRRSYSDMCRQIESMESQRRQENWDGINQNPAGVQHEWMSELTDLQAMPRSAGGSHTNTEANGVTQETGIIGPDGHIYKGFLSVQALKNTEMRLPTIASKDGVCKTKNKAKSSASQRRAASPEVGPITPVHQPPLSARSTQCSRSASSCSGRDWPVSALGCCTSQSSITSAAAESAADPQSDEPVNL